MLASLRKVSNISERRLIGTLLASFKPPLRISTKDWAETYRILSSEESSITGKFNCSRTPWMLYVMDCLDDPNIPVIVAMKSAQIAWTETISNYRGKRIHTDPCKMVVAFPRLASARAFYREKWKPFYTNTSILRDLINVNVIKESFNFFIFPGGFLKLITAGSVSEMKSSSIPYIEVEEPDDLKEDVNGQGDALKVLIERQKSFSKRKKKLIYGGTPTDKDFSKVENAYKQSNQLVYKIPCHFCEEFHELSFDNLHINEYSDRYVDEIYGKYDPDSASYICPLCLKPWTFEEKNMNVVRAVDFGNKGWYAKKPEVEEIYGFAFNELLSSFESSSFKELAKKKILAELELAKGYEGAMKSFTNNNKGLPYATGISLLEADELRSYRLNYPEYICPMDGLVLTAGVDVQDNRFAIVIRAWGKNNNSWLVTWKEIFGDVRNQDALIWQELLDEVVLKDVPHASGKTMRISAVSIDSADNTELVYKWVLLCQQHNTQVFATRGVRDLRYSEDEIYSEPRCMDIHRDQQYRRSLSERMGVTLFTVGTHRAHDEILRRINLNKFNESRQNRYYHNAQSYGQYEEQMTSCRKIIDVNSLSNKSVYKLVPGRRKEAIDAEKMAMHAAYAIGLRNMTHEYWYALEKYYS